MNLSQAVGLADLKQSKNGNLPRKTAENIAKYVFEVAARGGYPCEDTTVQDWAKRWLASNEFILTEVEANKVALPLMPHEQSVVLINASTDDNSEPLVVDLNKRGIGSTPSGFVPSVIVLDGRYRHKLATVRGQAKVKAWVGIRAARKLGIIRADHDFGSQELNNKLGECLREKFTSKTKGTDKASTPAGISYPWVTEVYPFEDYFIYQYEGKYYKQAYKADSKNRTVKINGTPEEVTLAYKTLKAASRKMTKIEAAAVLNSMPRQDVAQNGSAPHKGMPGVKGGKMYGHGGPGASLGNGSGPTPTTMRSGIDSPDIQAPGAGVGKRLAPDKGASNSEMQKRIFSADYIGKIVADYTAAVKGGYRTKGTLKAVAPPGMEDMVQKLKEKYGEKSATPFKIAWWKNSQGKN